MLGLHKRWIGLVVSLLLTIHAGLLAYGAYVHSPTLNEPGHLVAGISYWQFGRFDIYKVNPPLVRMVAAIPVLLAGAETDWKSYYEGPGARPEFALGEDLIAANGERSFWLFTLARWACIPFSLLGGYICYRWGEELYGSVAGLLSLTLWCFCPNIIAHGQLITCDVAAAAMGVTACYTFWRWLKAPTWTHTFLSGLVLGSAELTKMTLVIFYPLWPLMWLVYRWSERRRMTFRDWVRELGMLAARTLVAVYVVNLGYGFEGTGTRLGDFAFSSAALGNDEAGRNRFSDTWLESLPVIVPKNYVLGIDSQKRDFERPGQLSYLRGELRERGWWYYYLYALAIKMPIGIWTLIGLSAFAGFWKWRDEFILLCPALVILTFVSSQTGINQHMRYALPILPFVYIWIGRALALNETHRVLRVIVVTALVWSVASSLRSYPHSVAYFNELANEGSAHLIHSNIDWGQDLLKLRSWLESHPDIRPIKLAYYGSFDPLHGGIEYSPLEVADDGTVVLSAGWYAVSVNLVRGFPAAVYSGRGSTYHLRKDALCKLACYKPMADVGGSILIFQVP